MIAAHAGILQCLQCLAVEKPHGGAKVYAGLCGNVAVEVAEIAQVAARYGTPAGDEGVSADSVCLIGDRRTDGIFHADTLVTVDPSGKPARLGTPLAVLATQARACIDDGTCVDDISTPFYPYLVGGIGEAVGTVGVVEGQRLVNAYSFTLKSLLFQSVKHDCVI